MVHLSPRELFVWNKDGWFLYWGARRICSLRLWKWASVSIGAPLLGNMEGRSFLTAFERRDKFIYLAEFYKEFEINAKKTF